MHLKVFMKLKKTLKTLSSGQKNPKNPKNPKKPQKNQKNPLGWVFLKKTRVFSNPVIGISVSDPYSFFPDPEVEAGGQYGSRALMTKN
jgi:hypothetical protein